MFRITARPARRTAAAAAVCGALLGLGLTATTPASAVTAPDDRYTAQEIHTFLETFYGEHGPGDFARHYGISEQLKEKADQADGFDLLLCAQNTPKSIDIGEVTTAQSARAGWATVTNHWAGSGSTSEFTAYVDLDATRPIQLLDVSCGQED